MGLDFLRRNLLDNSTVHCHCCKLIHFFVFPAWQSLGLCFNWLWYRPRSLPLSLRCAPSLVLQFSPRKNRRSAMTTVVETSEEEPTMDVARTIANLAWYGADQDSVLCVRISEPAVAQFCKEAQSYLIDEQYPDLLNLLLTSADLVLEKTTEKDDGLWRSGQACRVLVQLLSIALFSPVQDSLFHLYNVLENPYGRFLIFKRVLEVAVVGKVTEHIVPALKRMDSLSQEWNVSESDKRGIFLSATNILKDQKGYTKDFYTFLVKYLAAFAVKEDPSKLNEAKEEALRVSRYVSETPVW